MQSFWLRWTMCMALSCTTLTVEAGHRWGLKEGTPSLKSAGQLAFGPDGILFIGDAIGAQVLAVDTGDATPAAASIAYDIKDLTKELAQLADGNGAITINDLAVNPLSQNVYLSLSIGESKAPGIVRVNGAGQLGWLSLVNVPFLTATLPNPPPDQVVGEGPRARNRRPDAITDLAYARGKLLVAGLTTEAVASRIREFPFPFADRETGLAVEIYHGAHGRVEDNAVVRTFIPMTIDGQPSLLAGFTCTPLVRFPIDALESSEKVRGTTVAELGNRNTPIDLLAYEQQGETFLLMSNTSRGVMKISTKEIGRSQGITAPVAETEGQPFETIKDLAGLTHFDRLSDTTIVALVQHEGGLSLKTATLP